MCMEVHNIYELGHKGNHSTIIINGLNDDAMFGL